MPAVPRFSILLPTHNRPEVLKTAIASVLAQTRQDWELLVVGDGCSEETRALMSGYRDARIRWFDLPKAKGFGYANRNVALKQAEGELIAFLGHDNIYFHDHLERMEVHFAQDDAAMCYSRPLFIDNDGLIVPFFVNITMGKPRQEFMTRNNVLPATNVVHRRNCFEAVGYWDENLDCEGDWELWKRIIAGYPRGLRFQRIPTCLHFRADWRTGKTWAPAPFGYMRALQAQAPWYPKALDMKFAADGELPQDKVWRAMQPAPGRFVGQLRASCDLLQEHLAWSHCMDRSFQ